MKRPKIAEICYADEENQGRFRAVLWAKFVTGTSLSDGSWYIYDILKDTFIRIGRVQLKGTNYFDRAVAEAKSRNKAWEEKKNVLLHSKAVL
jgi:hypothetical protein